MAYMLGVPAVEHGKPVSFLVKAKVEDAAFNRLLIHNSLITTL